MIGVILILLTLLVLGILPNSLNVLVVSAIISVISYKYRDFFKKSTIFYLLALTGVVVSVFFYNESWTMLITKGIIGYGFIVVVMFVGVLPNKWTLSRNIKMNRGIYSILGFIFISPHALLRIFGPDTVNIFGIIAYVIMIPLTIISFKVIRKEIEPKDWFNIQKAAYVIYAVLFVHLIYVADYPDKIVYAVLMTLYVNNKLLKEFRKWNY